MRRHRRFNERDRARASTPLLPEMPVQAILAGLRGHIGFRRPDAADSASEVREALAAELAADRDCR